MSRKPASDPTPDDPRPTPPQQPELEDCCNSGCSPCVFDLYDEALARYREALAAWEARQAERTKPAKRTARH
ncbi:oxidoreductase-like domain-containing protein [Burkholderia stagnalis]|uniref:oxidoreductase-like domain-containing protein n=1 Tax=Burkholderia stagnalis TaxID=1503054 RepID=UPI00075C4CC5|nr:oxidoreductase-like domain-containing protein [Burkholderia stagnalis]KVO53960.1 oxidoreductase [Burkholderia stagnalis]KVP07804.1 oxidoreductase [Burkholderia stagnalis]KVW89866.1 oxidoreductase [Burkholderia stagnalis]KWH66965.1 oxidoreductase [Burkholderia stagnalis]KWK16591.1 oxidoreductase [Burkholderia stagnalis]